MKKTKLSHIYAVKHGELVQEFTADKNGFIWFDEVGLLGSPMVYDTIEEAERKFKKYVNWLENDVELSTCYRCKKISETSDGKILHGSAWYCEFCLCLFKKNNVELKRDIGKINDYRYPLRHSEW